MPKYTTLRFFEPKTFGHIGWYYLRYFHFQLPAFTPADFVSCQKIVQQTIDSQFVFYAPTTTKTAFVFSALSMIKFKTYSMNCDSNLWVAGWNFLNVITRIKDFSVWNCIQLNSVAYFVTQTIIQPIIVVPFTITYGYFFVTTVKLC